MVMFTPPVKEVLFILHDVLGFSQEELDRDTCEAILKEAAKLASEQIASINLSGDAQGVCLEGGQVKTAKGFKEAYAAYCEGGWNAFSFDPEYDGQGLPWALAFPVQEMWQGANMSFGLCPILNHSAVGAITAHGSQEQKDTYLPKLISGEWTGTMNITEPQAGSDLGGISTCAVPQEDGTYKITGQKIFITYGDHDLTDNIIHLVLARIEGAREGSAGISLFIVPKILENEESNGVKCIRLEHKLGIHASPTCTMSFDNATGYLMGRQNVGLKYMFTMMQNARLAVGLQGVGLCERAYQEAYAYAHERRQGKASNEEGDKPSMIAKHPDVRRMLMDMHARTMAGRMIAYSAAFELDRAAAGDKQAAARADYLTPIIKSWCSDMAVEVASIGIQVHGGMGFMEESAAAQYYRDARVLPIYEGTNGIQASDFVFRKVARDKAALTTTYIKDMEGLVDDSYLEQLTAATHHIVSLNNDKKR
ncbi:MAG: acyl-CoA dehydrogenase family protein, partial [Alphaproteobacteria bacterium]|nr:acyl-CoA dehydrogenase family protein [Alphaproteobacteria bacterium]